jgi:hypothetical protein
MFQHFICLINSALVGKRTLTLLKMHIATIKIKKKTVTFCCMPHAKECNVMTVLRMHLGGF